MCGIRSPNPIGEAQSTLRRVQEFSDVGPLRGMQNPPDLMDYETCPNASGAV